jgi:phosphoribosyl-dephospho-CoA transferase
VWLNSIGWDTLQKAHTCSADILNLWRANNFPFVVRRNDNLSLQTIAIGLTLPLDRQKQTLALTTKFSYIDSFTEALDLRKAVVPKQWKDGINALIKDAQMHALDIKVYGSLAWQTLTQWDYLHPLSDIDCLIKIENQKQLLNALHLLQYHSLSLPLDGELIFYKEQAVSWKELINKSTPQSPTLLVKTSDGVRLVNRECFFKEFV